MKTYTTPKRVFTPSKSIVILLSVIAVSACSTTNEPELYPDITFDELSAINVDAAMVDVQMVYRPPSRSPHVEHLTPVSFETALNTWTDKRFVTLTSSENRIVVKVQQASIIEEPLAIQGGVSGALKKEQEFEYESVLEVTIQIIGLNDDVLNELTSRVWQRRTVTEGASAYEKRKIWLDIVENAIIELDTQLEPRLRQYFGD